MGINVSVYDCVTGNEHPDWDWCRHAGDKELVDFIFSKPVVHPENSIRGYDRENLFRPVSVKDTIFTFARGINYNQERWYKLVRLLDANPNLFIHAGY